MIGAKKILFVFFAILSLVSGCSSKPGEHERQSAYPTPMESSPADLQLKGSPSTNPTPGDSISAGSTVCNAQTDAVVLPKVDGTHLMDAESIKPGDVVSGLTVKSVNRPAPGYTTGIAVRFFEDVEVTGSFQYHRNHEYFADKIEIIPDPSLELPAFNQQMHIRIVISEVPDELKATLGGPGTSGTGTFILTDFTVRFA